MYHFFISGFALLLASPAACSVPVDGSFASPDVRYRPKFRYWLPDASVPSDIVQRDIASIAEVGAGGFEFLPFFQYGLAAADDGVAPPTDWAKYGFGTEAFEDVFLAALQATAQNGVLMDFSQGASEGQGVPAVPGTVGLAVELAYVNVTVAGGQAFTGQLPLSTQPPDLLGSFMHQLEEFGPQTLVAVTAVEITGQASAGAASTFSSITLGEVVDLTSSVSANNSLTWTAPEGTSSWRVIAWYQRYTNQRSCAGGLNATNYIQNGSWVVDHFSARGSQKLTDFFDSHVIPTSKARELLAAVGHYGWEDSMEMQTSLWWTLGFEDKFREAHGYNITPCLPYLIVADNYWVQSLVPYEEAFIATNSTMADKCNQDYRTTLNEGYLEYLGHYETWAHGLGIEYSAQPAYNLPLEMLEDIPILDAPEGESLGFENIIDAYRQFSGPAHLHGISVISSECGAMSGAPYQQTMNDLLWSVRRGLSTGISMHVLHGFAYSGPYANTTWPSYTTFEYSFTEMWNPHQPSWRHMNDSINYIARNQFVSQTGMPNIDLAFYLYASPWLVETQYENTNLETLGYTYEYLGSANLQAEQAVVEKNVLALDGPAYKALIFSNQTSITSGAAARIKEFAAAGLPIFFIGATNFTSIGMKAGEAENVTTAMNDVLNSGLRNVYKVASADNLPSALSAAGVLPKVAFSEGTSGWYSFWRRSDDVEYAYIYNDGNESQTSEVTFDVSGVPYSFDAWTGQVTPVLQYTSSSTGISITITLASNQTTIIGFSPANVTSSSNITSDLPASPNVHVTEDSGAVTRVVYTNGSLYAYLTGPGSVTLSNTQTHNFTASPPTASNLSSWNITIQDWHRTSDTFSMATAIDIHNYTNAALAPWLRLDPALAGVSGVGTYSATFTYPAQAGDSSSSSPLGAILHLGPITNTVRAWLNGAPLPPIDLTDAVVDISHLVLRTGAANSLVVEVATTLFNRVKADGNSTWSAGTTANEGNDGYYTTNAPFEYGLIGPVFVEWVFRENIA